MSTFFLALSIGIASVWALICVIFIMIVGCGGVAIILVLIIREAYLLFTDKLDD